MSEKDEAIRAATLLHIAGEDALELYNTFTWEDAGDDKRTDKIMEKLEAEKEPHLGTPRVSHEEPATR